MASNHSAAGLLEHDHQVRGVALRYWRGTRALAFDAEDLQQEMLAHLVARAPRYNVRCASFSTFVGRVAKNRALTLIERAAANKRRTPASLLPLEEVLENLQGIPDRRFPLKNVEERLILRIDVARLIKRLPRRLSLFALHLAQGATIAEAATDLGMSRAAGFRWRASLRREFARAGLNNQHH